MRKEVSPPVLIGAIVVAVLILGLIGWKMFVPSSGGGGSPDVLKAAHARKSKLDGGD